MKIILFTGNGCSGKTVLSYLFAQYMSKHNKTVLVHSDPRPTAKMLLPSAKLDHTRSLGKLLSVPDVTQAMIVENMHVLDDNFTALSYGLNENGLSYPEATLGHNKPTPS